MTVLLTLQLDRPVCIKDLIPFVEVDELRVGNKHRWNKADWVAMTDNSPGVASVLVNSERKDVGEVC